MEIAGTENPLDPAVRLLIREWSRFAAKPTPGEPGPEIDIGDRSLDAIKPGWVQTIYWRAQKAIKEYRGGLGTNLDMFSAHGSASPKKRRWRAGRQAPAPPYDPDVVIGGGFPADNPENHPDDLPF